MTVAVDADRVARGRDLGGERRVAPDLLADEEERRAHAGPLQHGERGGRSLRVRAVVEGQRDGAVVGDPVAHTSAPRSAGDHAHRPGRRVTGQHDRARSQRRRYRRPRP